MALRPGATARTIQERGVGAGPSGVVLANDGTNLILANSLSAGWLNEDGTGQFTIDDAESNRDGGFFTFGTEIELIYG